MPFATRVATRGFDSRRLHQTCYARDMRAVLLLCLAVAMCAASCRVAGQNDHNLSQLHDSDTRHRYRGVLVSDFEYVARTALGKSLENADLSLAQANEGKIANPTEGASTTWRTCYRSTATMPRSLPCSWSGVRA